MSGEFNRLLLLHLFQASRELMQNLVDEISSSEEDAYKTCITIYREHIKFLQEYTKKINKEYEDKDDLMLLIDYEFAYYNAIYEEEISKPFKKECVENEKEILEGYRNSFAKKLKEEENKND